MTLDEYDRFGQKIYADLGSGVQGLLTGQQTAQQVLQQMDSDWDAP